MGITVHSAHSAVLSCPQHPPPRSWYASRARPGLAATTGHGRRISYHTDRDHPGDRGGRGGAEDPARGASARRDGPTGRGRCGPLVRGEHGRECGLDRARDGWLCRCRAGGRAGHAAQPAGPEGRVRPGARAPRGAGAHRRRARADPRAGGDAPDARGYGVLAARRPLRRSRVVQLKQPADRRGDAGGSIARGGSGARDDPAHAAGGPEHARQARDRARVERGAQR
jgi:hypothetical protein